ncbi:hypothetical protein A1O7_10093 [Cladophialophora yegresii CBS 114405]|uniref:Uncharacterized protein n=1 Tax=Cladophialophora yegresii CBS 114405 TaxID=1182544 RepID=W9VGJ2_9EURO|nr:uncharacterized protein A1O7_10093 [Cladophialophora yegresii CBS 114405]EXJ54752.1 hypothetical protein A1O7_10093 [Cladophialophora yegresii CBS 114405]
MTTSSPLALPTAGVGGAYYDKAFQVPVYPNSPNDLATWRLLDTWNNIMVSYACTQGIATGLIWATLTYLLALTPDSKRTTPFHSFMLVGLVFLLIHMMIDIVSSLTPGIQLLTAYTAVTFDLANSIWTTKFIATFAASQVTGWFAFVFAAICLRIQAKGLMTGLRVRRPGVYKIVMGYLVLTSIAALAAGITYSIHQMTVLGEPATSDARAMDVTYTIRVAYLSSYAISIGSYSLVSMLAVMDIVWKRRTTISGGGPYASALNLVGLLCAQSFVIPFLFCVLQLIPLQTGMMHPDLMLLPSVYMILPLGSLFITVNSKPNPNVGNGNVESPWTPAFPTNNCRSPAQDAYTDSDMILTHQAAHPGPRPTSQHVHGSAHIDRELSTIDAMECGESARGRRGTDAEAEAEATAMLLNKDSQEKEMWSIRERQRPKQDPA